jgi:hypothetical protein
MYKVTAYDTDTVNKVLAVAERNHWNFRNLGPVDITFDRFVRDGRIYLAEELDRSEIPPKAFHIRDTVVQETHVEVIHVYIGHDVIEAPKPGRDWNKIWHDLKEKAVAAGKVIAVVAGAAIAVAGAVVAAATFMAAALIDPTYCIVIVTDDGEYFLIELYSWEA